MINRLIVEDDPTRIAHLYHHYSSRSDELTFTDKAQDAIHLLYDSVNPYTHIHLDNDLGPVENGEGRDVALELAKAAYSKEAFIAHIKSITIHSQNVVASMSMLETLERYMPDSCEVTRKPYTPADYN